MIIAVPALQQDDHGWIHSPGGAMIIIKIMIIITMITITIIIKMMIDQQAIPLRHLRQLSALGPWLRPQDTL